MSADTNIFHILTVTGHSTNSFDEAAQKAVEGEWKNHHEEFEKFVSYEVIETGGIITMQDNNPISRYSATVAISAVHRPHSH